MLRRPATSLSLALCTVGLLAGCGGVQPSSGDSSASVTESRPTVPPDDSTVPAEKVEEVPATPAPRPAIANVIRGMPQADSTAEAALRIESSFAVPEEVGTIEAIGVGDDKMAVALVKGANGEEFAVRSSPFISGDPAAYINGLSEQCQCKPTVVGKAPAIILRDAMQDVTLTWVESERRWSVFGLNIPDDFLVATAATVERANS